MAYSPQPAAEDRTDNPHSHISSPTLVLLVLLAAIGTILYFDFIMSPANRGDLLPYILVLAAESFIVTQVLVSLWTILAGSYNPRGFEYHDAQQNMFGRHGSKDRFRSLSPAQLRQAVHTPVYVHGKPVSIDIFITVYGEPLTDIARTAAAARDIVGLHRTYILDDGGSDDVRTLARQLGVGYIRRTGSHGAKAGNINHALGLTKGEYFVVFDADFAARPDFLFETMPFFQDRRIAFVQTPQYYDNQHNVISRGAGYMQRLFYRLIQPGKNRFNAAFCVGTNVVFRRSAVMRVGGIYDKSKSEDIWTSILLHELGYSSVFIPDILAVGKTPDSIKAYSKQQLRWATGGFQILLRHNPLTKQLTIDQKLQYLSTTSYYLHGFATMLLLFLPALHIFFNLTPVNLDIAFGAWLAYYLAFYGLQIVLAFCTMGGFRLESLLLAMVSFPIYIRAFFNALRGREEAWQATNSYGRDSIDSPFNYIIPQVLLFVFLGFTSLVGIWKSMYYESLALSLVWNMINTVIFGAFMLIAYREHRSIVRQRRQTATGLRRRTRAAGGLGRPGQLVLQTKEIHV